MSPPTPAAGPAVLELPVTLAQESLDLLCAGIGELWQRLLRQDAGADRDPLLLSYDVHPGPMGPVLIEMNTNAGGIVAAMAAARHVNDSCADAETVFAYRRLMDLFQRDLLGPCPTTAGHVVIADDDVAAQPLHTEMQELAGWMRTAGYDVSVVDTADLAFADGRLYHGTRPVERIYWRSTDFTLEDSRHAGIRAAVEAGTTSLAPSPAAWYAIADKRRLIALSQEPVLARDGDMSFRMARTLPFASRDTADWYAQRRDWVFKPAASHGSRGVYVGRKISRKRLESLSVPDYLAQEYAPHPTVCRDGQDWKYDLRLFADRDRVLGAAARVFRGQVMGLREAGSGFAPVHIGGACCIQGALAHSGAALSRR